MLYVFFLLTLALQCSSLQSINELEQDIAQVNLKLMEIGKECKSRMRKREFISSSLQRKWNKAYARTQTFRVELETINVSQGKWTPDELTRSLLNVLSIGHVALEDMKAVQKKLVVTVGDLYDQFNNLVSSYSNSMQKCVDDKVFLTGKLKRKHRYRIKITTRLQEIESSMNLALGDADIFIQNSRRLLQALKTLDSSADGYRFMEQTNKLSKLGRRTKKTLEECVAETKKLVFGFIPMKTLEESSMEKEDNF